MAIAELCKSCEKWLNEICAKIKTVSSRLAMDYKCSKLIGYHENTTDHKEVLHYIVETATHLLCLVIEQTGGINEMKNENV